MGPGRSVVIVGYYGFGNGGDEAILAALLSGLRNRDPGIRVTVLSGNPSDTSARHGVSAVAWSDLAGLADAIDGCDAVVVGGGGLFHDYWGVDPDTLLTDRGWGIPSYAAPMLLAALSGKPALIVGVGVGPLWTDAGRELTRQICDLASVVAVRDAGSRDLLSSIGVRAPVELTADLAFGFEPGAGDRAGALSLVPAGDGLLVAFALRGWDVAVHPSWWEGEVAAAAEIVVRTMGARVLFVPFQDLPGEIGDDAAVAKRIAGLVGSRSRVHVVQRPLSAGEAAALLSRCDVVVGMRLHSLLFALRAGVPSVALAYDPKVGGFMESMGLGEAVIDVGGVERSALAAAIVKARDGRPSLMGRLAPRLALLEAAAGRNVELIWSAIEAPRAPAGPPLPGRELFVTGIRAQVRSLATARAWAEAGRSRIAQLETVAEERSGRVAELERAAAELRAAHDERCAALEAAEKEQSSTSAAMALLEAERRCLERDLAGFRNEAEESRRSLAAREEELSSLGSTAREHRMRREELDGRLRTLSAEVVRLQADLARAQSLGERQKASEQRASAEAVKLNEENAALVRALAATRREVLEWKAAHDDSRASLEFTRDELRRWYASKLFGMGKTYWRLLQALTGKAAVRFPEDPATISPVAAPLPPKQAALESGAGSPPAQAEAVAAPLPVPARPAPHGVASSASGRYDVIVFPIIDWDFRFQRPQQLAAQFGRRGHRVLYLSATQFLPRGGEAWQTVVKERNVAEVRLRAARALDIYGGKLEEEDLAVLEESFAALAGDLGIADAVCKVDIPFWAPLVLRLRERFGWKVVYDCMDEWNNFPGFGAPVLAAEEALVRGADVTVVTADRLLLKWEKTAPVLMVRNGVDLEHYRRLYGPNRQLDPIAHPVIGYYGALASWVDVPLLAKIAKAFPDATVVLAGGQFDVDLRPVAGLPNVRLLGQRPYEEMPLLLWNFDACIIPFLVNEITEATNPVKFYEYISQGKPVVAPDLTELRPFSEVTYLASGHDDFVGKLRLALAEAADDPRRDRRREIAKENDWACRADAIDSAVRLSVPLVSVVVVTFGGLELTKACLQSLLTAETWPRMEVIVVDNASTDGTPDYLKAVAGGDSRVKVVLNGENRGFAAANNQGIEASEGEIVVLLNNDTVVPPGLLHRLAAHLRRDPAIGLLCPTTNFCGNEAKVDPDYDDLAGLPAYAARRGAENAGVVFDIPVAAMYCVALRREVLESVGPLDEAFGIGMFEDDDYALRIREAGLRVVCAEDAYVHHTGQGSFGKMPRDEYDRIWKENRARFEEKWGRPWRPHRVRRGVAAAVSKIR